MSAYGDKDPEDAWDDGDPIEVRRALLVRIVGSIVGEPDPARRGRRAIDALRLVAKVLS